MPIVAPRRRAVVRPTPVAVVKPRAAPVAVVAPPRARGPVVLAPPRRTVVAAPVVVAPRRRVVAAPVVVTPRRKVVVAPVVVAPPRRKVVVAPVVVAPARRRRPLVGATIAAATVASANKQTKKAKEEKEAAEELAEKAKKDLKKAEKETEKAKEDLEKAEKAKEERENHNVQQEQLPAYSTSNSSTNTYPNYPPPPNYSYNTINYKCHVTYPEEVKSETNSSYVSNYNSTPIETDQLSQEGDDVISTNKETEIEKEIICTMPVDLGEGPIDLNVYTNQTAEEAVKLFCEKEDLEYEEMKDCLVLPLKEALAA